MLKAPMRPRRSPIDIALCIVSGVALAVTLVAVGFGACAAFDAPTRMLSQAFSNDEDSPYTKEELTLAAIAAKHYTIDDNDRFELYTAMEAVAQSAEADGRELPEGLDLYAIYVESPRDLTNIDWNEDTAAGESDRLSYADEEPYVLTWDALSHLDDVYEVIQQAKPWLYAAALIAYIGCIAVAFRCGAEALGRVFKGAGAGVLVAFVVMAAWVAVDFNGFFAAFHSLFFAAGTWTFSWDSLLICMYPPGFWMGMGAIWLATTVAACAVCLIIGMLLTKRGRRDAVCAA